MVASRERGDEQRKPVYVIYGSDAYLKREALSSVIHRVLGAAEPHMAVSEYEGDSAALADVLDDLRTPPFLAEVRLVVVADADPFITQHRQSLETYVAAPSDTGVLVLVCRSFPKTTKLAKTVARIGTVHACVPLKPGAIAGWLIQRSETGYGKRLARDAATLLQRLVGDEIGLLDSELSKLAVYVGKRAAIKPEDVDALVGHHREGKVFGILDAVNARDARAALELWEQVWATDRAAPGRAIGGLAWAVRDRLNGQRSDRSTWRSTPRRPVPEGGHPLSARDLEDQLVDLLSADLKAKTGVGSVQSAVQQFIVAWCTREHED